MHTMMVRIGLALALNFGALGIGSAGAEDFFNQDWMLNSELSRLHMETVKKNAIFEVFRFTELDGSVKKNGDANVTIDLSSINTGVDILDVRLRYLLFETFKFPEAEISAKLDKTKLQALLKTTRISYPLAFKLNMHGVVQELQATVSVTRLSDTTVSIATIKPIIVTAESLGLTKKIAKLMEIVDGIPIATGASITFDLIFGTGRPKPEVATTGEKSVKPKAEKEVKNITAEACETRFNVISQTSAIYFKTGSAELDQKSEPLLNSVVDIANRCPSVKFDVSGHTDDVGDENFNQRLSERRAKSVVDYLTKKGVNATRIKSAGFGETRPVAPNDNEENRAKNRRIEFKVNKG